jgi:hypothetical protein
MLKLLATLSAALLLSGGVALAQMRAIPANAKRANVGQQQFAMPYIDLNGARVKLSPGAVIYDQNNRTLVHSALPHGAQIAYTLDMNGDVSRIYILTPQEQAQFVPQK